MGLDRYGPLRDPNGYRYRVLHGKKRFAPCKSSIIRVSGVVQELERSMLFGTSLVETTECVCCANRVLKVRACVYAAKLCCNVSWSANNRQPCAAKCGWVQTHNLLVLQNGHSIARGVNKQQMYQIGKSNLMYLCLNTPK